MLRYDVIPALAAAAQSCMMSIYFAQTQIVGFDTPIQYGRPRQNDQIPPTTTPQQSITKVSGRIDRMQC